MKGKTFYTVHLYHCICSRMCVRRLHRAFPAFSLVKHTVQSSADGWHMRPEFPTCTMTQIFTLCFHRALPSTAALLTRALRFNYWPVSTLKPHLLSRTGNCLSQCKGGNWIAGLLGKMYTHCSCAYLIMLWIVGRLHNSELEAYPSWVILYKRSDRESRFGTHWDCFNQEVKNGFQSLRKKKVNTGKFTSDCFGFGLLCLFFCFFPPFLCLCPVVSQEKVVQLQLLSLFYP